MQVKLMVGLTRPVLILHNEKKETNNVQDSVKRTESQISMLGTDK